MKSVIDVSISGVNRISETDTMSAVPTLRSGGVAVLRTDTVYGIVACADDERACERVYAAKGRDGSKPCIVLIANDAQIWDSVSRKAFREAEVHAGDEPTSVVVPAGSNTPAWIPHDNGTVAFRIPSKPDLCRLLLASGPLIAPSANPAGEEPAATIEQAEAYFGDAVDVYVNSGKVEGAKPSHIIKVSDTGEVERIR